jgi:hypothetical protein
LSQVYVRLLKGFSSAPNRCFHCQSTADRDDRFGLEFESRRSVEGRYSLKAWYPCPDSNRGARFRNCTLPVLACPSSSPGVPLRT